MNSKENEVIVDVYQKGGKPMESTGTRKKGSKKNVNLKEGQQSFQSAPQKYTKEMINNIFEKQEEEMLQAELTKKQLVSSPTKREFEEKIASINSVLPGRFSNGQIKQVLRNCNMDEYEAIYLLQSSDAQETQERNAIQQQKQNGKRLGNPLIRTAQSEEMSLFEQRGTISIGERAQDIISLKSMFQCISDKIIKEAYINQNYSLQETVLFLSDDDQLQRIISDICFQDGLEESKGIIEFLASEVQNVKLQELYSTQEFENIKSNYTAEELLDPEVQNSLKIIQIFLQQIDMIKSQAESRSEKPEVQEDTSSWHPAKGSIQYNLMCFAENHMYEKFKDQQERSFNVKESDFPMIKEDYQESGNQNIVKELTKNPKKQYDVHKDQWNSNIAIFKHDDVTLLGQQYLQQLSTEFPFMERDALVLIFQDLGEEYELTHKFLLEQFPNQIQRTNTITIAIKNPSVQKICKRVKSLKWDSLEEMAQSFRKQYGDYSFQQLRKEILNAQELNMVMKVAERNNDKVGMRILQKYCRSQKDMSLSEMQAYSKTLFLLQLRSSSQMLSIDLHGFFKEEALDILKDHIMYLKTLAREGRHSEIQINRNMIQLNVITGKGLHSKNGTVLKPLIEKFLAQAGFPITTGEGNILVRIPF